ncbi:MAG TPA: hypothetical protein VGF94_01960 [Kofleriaceae bacterium]
MSPDDLKAIRKAVTGLTSVEAIRRAAGEILKGLPSSLGLALDDAVVLLQLATTVANDSDDAELSRFLRTGRLPEIVSLTPRQMEYVRGGRLTVTETRGLAPATILFALCRLPDGEAR